MASQMREVITHRKSVRSFDGRPLLPEDRERMEEYLCAAENPFGVPVCFRLLDAKEHGLSSPVIVGTDAYLAAKVRQEPNYEIAFGYSFEAACLFAASLGLGTVMLAASLSRAAFEKAMELGEDEVMPVASPIGYPAEKRSIRESLMRKGLKADTRLPFETLFFEGSFATGLSPKRAGDFADALEMARWAPSAANQQPWRAVVQDGAVHFFEKKSMKDSPLGDIQKVDVGNALAHFDLTLREGGVGGRFLAEEPALNLPENVRYVISYERNR